MTRKNDTQYGVSSDNGEAVSDTFCRADSVLSALIFMAAVTSLNGTGIRFSVKFLFESKKQANFNKLCAWRHNMPLPINSPVGALAPRAPPSRCNVAVLSHADYVPMLTAAAALRVKATLSKAAW